MNANKWRRTTKSPSNDKNFSSAQIQPQALPPLYSLPTLLSWVVQLPQAKLHANVFIQKNLLAKPKEGKLKSDDGKTEWGWKKNTRNNPNCDGETREEKASRGWIAHSVAWKEVKTSTVRLNVTAFEWYLWSLTLCNQTMRGAKIMRKSREKFKSWLDETKKTLSEIREFSQRSSVVGKFWEALRVSLTLSIAQQHRQPSSTSIYTFNRTRLPTIYVAS